MNHDCVHFPRNALVQTQRTYAELGGEDPGALNSASIAGP